ncbi:Nuclear condensin complex subunit 3 [Rasamsonia emersonii CBS 393.64]|uniref:Nuclear condensin complex subunit 3 n=1 Tax=Rasamsonia emersonii (strain ATCC 16479 / CBS 393.64 / IMI 116815) TaxID=1408163 RepID=A0A0F4YPI1_RASE3|nr:Nuclear condensin complex subunit 3 [Rasamsonia emersonii CBS 393.64]KKA19553.1 Nuclear condensin complex subunit 3 [Rasamsonia emersonii CBS 393.64]
MPARTAPPPSTATRKASGQSTASGKRAPSATPSVAIPEEPAAPSTSPHLRADVCAIFADAQRSTTGHRKLVVRLRKIQEHCCGIASKKAKKDPKQADQQDEEGGDVPPSEETLAEKEFNVEITRCMLRVLPVKKTEPVGDRIIRFLGLFLSHASEKDAEVFAPSDADETEIETPTSRLTFNLASTIVPLLAAKDKVVRYRATQIISHIVNSLDAIDDEVYRMIRHGLLRRIRDKEAAVRVQAVLGLSRLVGNEGDDEDDDDGSTALLEKLIDILQNDAAADVRKTLLLNLPLTPATLPYLLERARDLDAATRRALYSRLLPTLGDFRHLSLSMREKLLRWGLRDRDENVRKATGKLFYERWIEDCAGNHPEEGGPVNQLSPPNMSALLELLERIDVVNSGMEGGVAHEAMRSFWEGRPDYREAVVFDEKFWDDLTAESAFLARSFNDFCRVENEDKYEDLADEKMPEVTALAHFLGKYSSALLGKLKQANLTGGTNEGDTMEIEFVVEQLLHIALTLDYSDEVGRRKMFSLLRENLAVPELPEECTKLTVEVLRVVLEAVAEVHDAITTEDSFVSAKSEISDDTSSVSRSTRSRSETPGTDEEVPFDKEKAKAKILREIMINMKCLHIAQCMLQNVETNLQQNMHLVTMLNNLVVPAVRSHEAPIRERGLECLGLCCLLDKTLAEENMTLFIHCFNKGHEALQVTALQILADMLATHPSLLAPVAQQDSDTVSPPAFQKPLLKAFAKALKANSPPSVQATAATALSKLLLTNALSPSGPNVPPAIKELNESSIETLLQSLIVSYFHPRTRENPVLRQALTYFFPVYCHSRLANTQRMRKVAVPVVRAVLNAAEEFFSLEAEEDSDGDIDETASEREVKALMAGVIGMLVEWTDERRVVGLGGENVLAGGAASSSAHGYVHLALVKDILERVLGISTGPTKCSKEEKKLLISMLGKVYISAPTPPSRAGSRAPEGEDVFRSSGRSMREEIDPANIELAETVKTLLDQAIEDGVAPDAAGRNALVKVKNTILKLLAAVQTQPSDNKDAGRRERAGTEETEYTSAESRASREPSVVGGHGTVQVVIDNTIVEEDEEEDENDESKGTVIKTERDSQEPE